MFTNNVINNYLETSNSISTISKVTAEWNFNNPENISSVGNYRYRPLESNSLYNIINNTYDPNDYGNFYTNATDADIEIDGGFNNLDEPQIFISKKDKEKQLNSLESCFEKFRPR
jgi:dTDP-4-dehydrorhamnose 3,5-epimerase-like enzyme